MDDPWSPSESYGEALEQARADAEREGRGSELEWPVPEESRYERTERLADDIEERYGHPRRY